jgi:hypothetical protein
MLEMLGMGWDGMIFFLSSSFRSAEWTGAKTPFSTMFFNSSSSAASPSLPYFASHFLHDVGGG